MNNETSKRSFIPWLFVLAFLFVLAANGTMITVALDSFPGFSEGYKAERSLDDRHD